MNGLDIKKIGWAAAFKKVGWTPDEFRDAMDRLKPHAYHNEAQTYCIAIPVTDSIEANRVANSVVKTFIGEYSPWDFLEVDHRIQGCWDDEEKRYLIEEEIAKIQYKVSVGRDPSSEWHYYWAGWSAEKTHKEYRFNLPLSITAANLPSNFNQYTFILLAEGGRGWRLEKYLRSLLNNLATPRDNSQTKSLQPEDTTLPQEAPQPKITQRLQALIYDYKEKAKLVEPLSKAERKALGGQGLVRNFYSISPGSYNYRPTKEDELKIVIQMLSEFPEASVIALSDLKKLQK